MVNLNPTTTIRTELDQFIQREGINYSQFAQRADLNVGTVSSVLKGNRIMAVDQLDRMTSVLSLPKGHFYEQYIQECMIETVPNWRRIKPYLYRCAELDKLHCIQQILLLIMDNLTYPALIFGVAEDFFALGRNAAAALLYECVATSERRQHSERLAFCQYRMFTLRLGDNQEQNLQAALQFEPFIDRLDEMNQLDALRDLANIYRSLHRWDKVSKVAVELGYKAEIQLRLHHQTERRRREPKKKPSRPLFSYWALSNLFQASVCDANGDYEQALTFNYAYADLSWVKEKDDETLHWVNQFKEWGRANIYVSKLMIGDDSGLADYVTYIKQNKNETLTGLLNILKAANIFNMDVAEILEQFKLEINSYIYQKDQQAIGVYSKQVNAERVVRLLYEMAYYYLKREYYSSGFNYLLDFMSKSVILNKEALILKCVKLFERFREFASSELQEKYQNLLNEEDEDEKEISIATNFV